MKKEDWVIIQRFVDAGQVELFIDHIIGYIKHELTSEQFEKMGDIKKHFLNILSHKSKNQVSAKNIVDHFIQLVKDGAIKGVRKDV